MPDVHIGLGANLGDPAANLRTAVEKLEGVVEIVAVSSLYRTEPVGLREQPSFLNAVVQARTELEPAELMRRLLEIERGMGRRRDVAMGPRTIDLDLLLYGARIVDEPGLVVPHPAMTRRRFVLVPLAEIAPDAVHPPSGRSAAELLAALPRDEAVERLDGPEWRRPI
jgi:2-amino-4-hydroxy-6-hydroxymethyldihydropteridine diphosphokinase